MSALLSVSVFTASSICRRRLRTLLSSSVPNAHHTASKSRTFADHLHRNRCNTPLPPVLCISIVFPTDHKICIITKYLSVVCQYDVFIRCTQCIVRKPLHLIFCGRLVYRCPSKKPNCICNSTLYGKQGQYTASPPFSNDPHLSADRTVYYMYFGFSVHSTMSDAF